MFFQIFHRSSLAHWICQTSLYKLAEHFIVNTIENNPVKSAVQYSENAVRTHLWVAIIAYLIIAKIKADYKSPYSITEVATLIRISALERVDLRDLITKPKDSIIQKQDVKELTLFDEF